MHKVIIGIHHIYSDNWTVQKSENFNTFKAKKKKKMTQFCGYGFVGEIWLIIFLYKAIYSIPHKQVAKSIE